MIVKNAQFIAYKYLYLHICMYVGVNVLVSAIANKVTAVMTTRILYSHSCWYAFKLKLICSADADVHDDDCYAFRWHCWCCWCCRTLWNCCFCVMWANTLENCGKFITVHCSSNNTVYIYIYSIYCVYIYNIHIYWFVRLHGYEKITVLSEERVN